MALDRNALFAEAKKAIVENDVIFFDELVAYLPLCKTSLYAHFPAASDEMNVLKGLIGENRVSKKRDLRKKWMNSDNASTQICLYKLMSTAEERDILTDSRHEKEDAPTNPRIVMPETERKTVKAVAV